MRILEENSLLVAYIPATNRALVWRVKSIVNKYSTELNYGHLPIKAGEMLPTYEGGSALVPADGVLPARSYTPGKTFPMPGAFDETDMWYIPEEYRERIFHVIQRITPSFIRVDIQIPVGVVQGRFQRDKIMTGVDKDFGFVRGAFETIHIPKVHYGYRYGNDSNIAIKTFVKFTYCEYIVEIPRNADLIFDVLTKKVPSYWITLPINVMDVTIENALDLTYGIPGFTVYYSDQREKALQKYKELLRRLKV